MNPTAQIKLPNNQVLDLKDKNAGYSVEILNGYLNLKNADGTIISSVELPSSLKVERVDYESLSSMTDGVDPKDNNNNTLAFVPVSFVVIGEHNRVIARVVGGSSLNRVGSTVNITNLPSISLTPNEVKAVPIVSSTMTKKFSVSDNLNMYSLANYIYSPHFEQTLSPNSPIIREERYGIIRDEFNVFKASAILTELSGMIIANQSNINNTSISSTDRFESYMYNLADVDIYAVNFYSEFDQPKVVFLAQSSHKTVSNNILTITDIINADSATVSVIDETGIVSRSSTINITEGTLNIGLAPISGTELNTIKINAKAFGADSQSLTFFVTCPSGYTADI